MNTRIQLFLPLQTLLGYQSCSEPGSRLGLVDMIKKVSRLRTHKYSTRQNQINCILSWSLGNSTDLQCAATKLQMLRAS